ncbi:transcriptional regulator, LysR family [Shewanella sediminis HAW-EB3]|uniref:Transcriptional regulator, LysR family n=1 Tax=Shewanella sediminis (strain HAW-EB3) TaxID=425104 RepID=A8FR15_SHESH|nr:LysR family transcriptional regulator [Shewanella sediminis]ABV35288.1 transcriptional regulator, LysR family [Shewanella sediminis HAW-EB3]
MLNPLWLNTFKTLIDLGHFTRTAEKLHMTQPGVSQQIQKLEKACGHSLIKREKKSFELTEQGRLVYGYALKIAEDEANLIETLGFDNPYAGQCKLSCSGSQALQLYPALLSLQLQHPELSVQLEAAPNQKILHDLQSGKIDLGIVTHTPESGLYRSTVIGEETLCLVLPKQYENRGIDPERLIECGLIDHPDAKHYLSLYFEHCGEKALAKMSQDEVPKSGYINQVNQILLPVAKGLGFTVLPESAVKNFPLRDKLYIAHTAKQVKETLYLVQKRNRNLPSRYQTVSQLLRSII